MLHIDHITKRWWYYSSWALIWSKDTTCISARRHICFSCERTSCLRALATLTKKTRNFIPQNIKPFHGQLLKLQLRWITASTCAIKVIIKMIKINPTLQCEAFTRCCCQFGLYIQYKGSGSWTGDSGSILLKPLRVYNDLFHTTPPSALPAYISKSNLSVLDLSVG